MSPVAKSGVVQACSACIHYRHAKPVDPLAGWHVLSPKVFELRAKWEKHMAERGLWEQQRLESGLAFDFEPQAYAYCEHFTQRSSQPPLFVLCAVRNPPDKNECPAFEERVETRP